MSIKSRLTEEVQPDYVVLTLPIGKPHQEGLDESVNIGFLQRAQKLFGNNEFAQFERQGKLQASVYFSLDCGRLAVNDRPRHPN